MPKTKFRPSVKCYHEEKNRFEVYSIEDLRKISKARGEILRILDDFSNPHEKAVSAYGRGVGVVLSKANNPDNPTSAYVNVYYGVWGPTKYADEDSLPIAFPCTRSHRLIRAKFPGYLADEPYKYALNLGCDIGDALLELEVYETPNTYPKKKSPIKSKWLEDSGYAPRIATFIYCPRPEYELTITVWAKAPIVYDFYGTQIHNKGSFHFLQLAQIV